MRALFVGRFQPFHLGHLKAVEYVAKVANHVIIAIGSSQENNTLENPFSYEERIKMIEKSLRLSKDRYTIVPVPDFGDEKIWVEYVSKKLPKFDVVYANAPREKKIFKNAHMQLRNVPLYDRTIYNGTDIRRRISSGSRWENLVPKGTAEVIKKVDGVKRISRLFLI
ncbi:MAG: nicotinamide-nucleotide adenylyltransferase [Candidatus Altiarchaeales archaeon]|nr:nicotinamide-nucleotide adenylyltransferase [Candidatus Altiarchaeales archaeon]